MNPVLPVRVMVHDVWDEVKLEVPASVTVGEVKRLALERARVVRDPAGYLVKHNGAEVQDERRTLLDEGVAPNAPLIVLARQRRPVR